MRWGTNKAHQPDFRSRVDRELLAWSGGVVELPSCQLSECDLVTRSCGGLHRCSPWGSATSSDTVCLTLVSTSRRQTFSPSGARQGAGLHSIPTSVLVPTRLSMAGFDGTLPALGRSAHQSRGVPAAPHQEHCEFGGKSINSSSHGFSVTLRRVGVLRTMMFSCLPFTIFFVGEGSGVVVGEERE